MTPPDAQRHKRPSTLERSLSDAADPHPTLKHTSEIRLRFQRGLSSVGEDNEDDKLAVMGDLSMREGVVYDPERPLASLFRLRGTVLLALFTRRLELYIYLLLGATTFIVDRYGLPLPDLDVESLLGIPIGLQTISLVFYNQQAYQRFYDQYFHTMTLIRTVKGIVTTAIAWWPVPKGKPESVDEGGIGDFSMPRSWLVGSSPSVPATSTTGMAKDVNAGRVRQLKGYLNAAHAFTFCQLNKDYRRSTNPIEYCEQLGFISETEAKVFQKTTGATLDHPHAQESGRIGAMHAQICVGWARQLVHSTFEDGTISPPQVAALNSELNNLSFEIQRIYEYRDQPIPFMYVHYVSQFLFITCSLLAFAAGSSHSVSSLVTALITGFMLLGLREVSIMLSEPFGEDLSDLPALDYVHTTVLDTELLSSALALDAGVRSTAHKSSLTLHHMNTGTRHPARINSRRTGTASYQRTPQASRKPSRQHIDVQAAST